MGPACLPVCRGGEVEWGGQIRCMLLRPRRRPGKFPKRSSLDPLGQAERVLEPAGALRHPLMPGHRGQSFGQKMGRGNQGSKSFRRAAFLFLYRLAKGLAGRLRLL